jgi:hypothetical protein
LAPLELSNFAVVPMGSQYFSDRWANFERDRLALEAIGSAVAAIAHIDSGCAEVRAVISSRDGGDRLRARRERAQ